jgi:hypothetical protein
MTIAHKFRDEGLVKEEDWPRFDKAIRSFEGGEGTIIAQVMMLALVYSFVASTISIIAASPLMPGVLVRMAFLPFLRPVHGMPWSAFP